jgi:4-hydroxy-3-polyprenylbenzoate decarboxylase
MVEERSPPHGSTPLAYDDLRDWIKTLEKYGELKRIREEVSPELEITEITDRVSKIGSRSHPFRDEAAEKGGATGTKDKYAPGGPALLFENVKGHPGHKVLINQFGSERRMALALGVDRLDEIAERIRGLMDVKAPEGLFDKLKMLPQLGALTSAFPKTVTAKDAPCKEIVRREHFDLNYFPILKCWPRDGGRFITLPCVHTRDPQTGKRNIGMYRMQVYDGQTTGMHWQRQKVAAEHYREALRAAASRTSDEAGAAGARVAMMAESAGGAVSLPEGAIGGMQQISLGNLKGSRLEVAVSIGTDPATTFAAVVPAPPEVEEFLVAGFLRGKPVEIVKCETVDLEVPAHAEIVLEGYVELGELRAEGPFGDHTGFYTLEDEYPVFHLTCVTHRKDPIYAATIVGKPPMEDAWMGKAVERIFLPAMKMTIPELVDIHLPVEAVFHNLMIVSIKKSYPGQARKVMHAIWSLGQAMFTKCIIVVDEDCDVQNIPEVVLRVANNIDPERDIQFTLGPVDSLDHAARLPNYGSKMGVDATRKWKAEGFERPWPAMIEMDRATKAKVDAMWAKLGL